MRNMSAEYLSMLDRWVGALAHKNMLIIRNAPDFGELLRGFETKGYRVYEDRYGRTEIDTVVSPGSLDYAERMKGGFFHTDFSSMDNPPDYTIIYCVRQDPRSPYFGRNQIAQVKDVYSFLSSVSPELAHMTTHVQLPFKTRGPVQWRTPFYAYKSKIAARHHPGLIFRDGGFKKDLFDGKPLSDYIEESAISCCVDVSLDTGDALVCSNKFCLHRRSDSSVRFEKGGKIQSRRVKISFLVDETEASHLRFDDHDAS